MSVTTVVTLGGVLVPAGIKVLKAVGKQVLKGISGGGLTTQQILSQQGTTLGAAGPVTGSTFPEGASIDIDSQGLPQGTVFKVDPVSGEIVILKRRRRRKRLLTCSDKADMAFVTGTLGKGQMGQAAISSLLSRCG